MRVSVVQSPPRHEHPTHLDVKTTLRVRHDYGSIVPRSHSSLALF